MHVFDYTHTSFHIEKPGKLMVSIAAQSQCHCCLFLEYYYMYTCKNAQHGYNLLTGMNKVELA